MKISVKEYKKIKNDGELKKSGKKLKTAFNLFIRLRDLSKVEETGQILGKCISCGISWLVGLYSDKSIINAHGNWVAGHYWKDDRYASVRYDERNVNLQCSRCNKYLSGNESNYAINLKKKIGEKEFDKLNIERNKTKNLNILDIDRMVYEYRDKAKAEAKRLSIKI
jgi:hypothetical protein